MGGDVADHGVRVALSAYRAARRLRHGPARARRYPQAPPKLSRIRQHAGVLALGFRATESPFAVVDHRKYPVQRGAPGAHPVDGRPARAPSGGRNTETNSRTLVFSLTTLHARPLSL